MGRFIQLVMGPAGVGKSTYCKTLQDHGKASHRSIHVANLDPAADTYEYDSAFDIKDLITVEEAMVEHGYGPNGGLVYCMEYLLQNMDWLKEELDNFGEDDYIVLDCPGQVELYSHLPIMHNIAQTLQSWGFRVAGVYLLDALFVLEPAKFISGCLLSLSCMLQLEVPHINVITKCDIADKEAISRVLDSEGAGALYSGVSAAENTHPGLRRLTSAISEVIDDYMMVSFGMLDPTDEDSIELVLAQVDHCVQYGKETKQTLS